MSVFEVIGGIIMVLMSIAISLLVLLQEGTKGGGITALTGGDSDSFFGKNGGRTRDAMLYRATRFCAIVFFIVTIIVYGLNVYMA
ncbi:MAG: preprotein translocase subunit SecG [Oscillospiraceae bacterium]|jgi:preprotein translocase subunit SecG